MTKRKGPTNSATEYNIGTIKKGNDGNMWIIVENKNKVKRWKKINNKTKKNIKTKKNKTNKKTNILGKKYYTHHNGSRPYKVIINGQNVKIYKLRNDYNNYTEPKSDDYNDLIKEYKNVKKIFIGKSIKGDDAYASFGNNSKKAQKFGIGNSILINISKYKYSFIGETVYEFKINEEITDYFSMIDRNDSPLPLALGKKNIYFLMHNAYYGMIDRKYFEDFPKKHNWGLDSYSRLWGINKFTDVGQLTENKKINVKILSN